MGKCKELYDWEEVIIRNLEPSVTEEGEVKETICKNSECDIKKCEIKVLYGIRKGVENGAKMPVFMLPRDKALRLDRKKRIKVG